MCVRCSSANETVQLHTCHCAANDAEREAIEAREVCSIFQKPHANSILFFLQPANGLLMAFCLYFTLSIFLSSTDHKLRHTAQLFRWRWLYFLDWFLLRPPSRTAQTEKKNQKCTLEPNSHCNELCFALLCVPSSESSVCSSSWCALVRFTCMCWSFFSHTTAITASTGKSWWCVYKNH